MALFSDYPRAKSIESVNTGISMEDILFLPQNSHDDAGILDSIVENPPSVVVATKDYRKGPDRRTIEGKGNCDQRVIS